MSEKFNPFFVNHFTNDSLGDPMTCVVSSHNHPPREVDDASEDKPALGKVMGLFYRLTTDLRAEAEGAHGGEADGRASALETVISYRSAFERVNRELIEAQPVGPPTPGLTYVDPIQYFECTPAVPEWRELSREPELYSVLELRVMAAYLTTGLDNVTQALRAKGAGA